MRYPATEKLEIIRLVEQSHLSARQTLDKLGIPRPTFYRWYSRFLAHGVEHIGYSLFGQWINMCATIRTDYATGLEIHRASKRRKTCPRSALNDTIGEAVLELSIVVKASRISRFIGLFGPARPDTIRDAVAKGPIAKVLNGSHRMLHSKILRQGRVITV